MSVICIYSIGCANDCACAYDCLCICAPTDYAAVRIVVVIVKHCKHQRLQGGGDGDEDGGGGDGNAGTGMLPAFPANVVPLGRRIRGTIESSRTCWQPSGRIGSGLGFALDEHKFILRCWGWVGGERTPEHQPVDGIELAVISSSASGIEHWLCHHVAVTLSRLSSCGISFYVCVVNCTIFATNKSRNAEMGSLTRLLNLPSVPMRLTTIKAYESNENLIETHKTSLTNAIKHVPKVQHTGRL